MFLIKKQLSWYRYTHAREQKKQTIVNYVKGLTKNHIHSTHWIEVDWRVAIAKRVDTIIITTVAFKLLYSCYFSIWCILAQIVDTKHNGYLFFFFCVLFLHLTLSFCSTGDNVPFTKLTRLLSINNVTIQQMDNNTEPTNYLLPFFCFILKLPNHK